MEEPVNEVLNIYKRRSETPLQALSRCAKSRPELRGAKMTYAGRLDPMAEGVLVALVGDANKERERYIGLDKEYEFEFALGVETDTHDLLGKVTAIHAPGDISLVEVAVALARYQGSFEQAYPAYSSKVVLGASLIDHARAGRSVPLPTHMVTASKIELIGVESRDRDGFFADLRSRIEAVRGDFRQSEILRLWSKYEREAPQTIAIYRARIVCESGFYVRQLVSDVGRDLKTGATTVSILRTRVGEYRLEDSIR